ncbi:tyrosine-type recombinase/integrase [Heyndrickxia acidicola]|uniref:Tyrosine-type recombinase/integrase n=1 Tax=Heyndrickxia acidicola TaxID=209389 RepID=A0ABU6MDG3_9BACI|nr:tyrosine-type recombinase/integrase [Heyndrickxia acidicola]MED1202550.1 tyrosine-type recombinase/integrase [Heyndrickxia acidicola]
MRKGRKHKALKSGVRETASNLDDLFRTFIEIKKAEGRAPRTLGQYEDNYGYFTTYLDVKGIKRYVSEITKEVIRNYITYMRDELVKFEGHRFKTKESMTKGLAPSSINTRLKTLRVIFKCLLEEDLIDYDPTQGVKNVSEPQENIEILSAEELKKLLKVPNTRYYPDFRDYVLMHLLIDGMMRISEALGLTVNDFDFHNRTVIIPAGIAKNRKSRVVPLEQRTMRLVKELYEENRVDFDNEYLFLTNYGEPMGRDRFGKRLKDFAIQAGITKNVHPHLFRHTSATLFLEAGGDLRHLQMILGHSDLRVIIRYTHLSSQALKNQHDLYSPIKEVSEKLNRPRKIKR